MAMQNCFKRYEKKYCLTKAQQRVILEGMRPYMKKDTYGQYTICNIYYDTDDWRLIRTSLEKPVYKEKLRVRSYGTPLWLSHLLAEAEAYPASYSKYGACYRYDMPGTAACTKTKEGISCA